MPLEERRALVPKKETERERKELIVIYTELIADTEKELEAKVEDLKKFKGEIAELRRCRAKIERRTLIP